MMISTKGRYALRVMVDLAENRKDGFTPLRDIAKRQDLSEKYLEAILPALIKNNYLEGLRGKGGGYRLSREPESYTVGGILKTLESNLAPVECLKDGGKRCDRAERCKTLPMWEKLHEMIDAYFESITLADLCAGKQGADTEFPD